MRLPSLPPPGGVLGMPNSSCTTHRNTIEKIGFPSNRRWGSGPPDPQVVGQMWPHADVLATDLERHGPVGGYPHHVDVRPRHQPALLEEPHDRQVQLEVFRETFQDHPI